MTKVNKANLDNNKSDRLIVIPYVNSQGIIGEPNQVIEYKFYNLIFRNMIKDSPPKYILLTPKTRLEQYAPGVRAEIISVDYLSETSVILQLKTIEGVFIHLFNPLEGGIATANYKVIHDENFAEIKRDVEKLILDIKYIQDEHMPTLPEFDLESNIESLKQYSYRLSFFIASFVSKYVKIDNEDLLYGNSLVRLRIARHALLKYLDNKAKEEKEKQYPIFQEKLLSNKIFPAIPIDSTYQEKIVPWVYNHNICISKAIQNELIRYTRILQREDYYVVLIPEFDMELLDNNIGKKTIGILASFKDVFADPPAERYSSLKLEIIPRKTVMVSIVQEYEYKGEYGESKYIFYCEVQDLECEVCDYENLQVLITKSLNIFREIEKYSGNSIISFNKNMANKINYAINISHYLIYHIISKLPYYTIKLTDIVNINNLEARYEAIEVLLFKILDTERKKALKKIKNKVNESVKEVKDIPQGFSFLLFNNQVQIAECLSLFGTIRVYLTSYSITEAEQIELNYYNNEKTILIVKGNSGDFSPDTNTLPYILAKVNSVEINEDNGAYIYITPEQRVNIKEVVLKDGMFYGKAEEIIVPKSTSIEELSQLRKLVEKLITLYQKTTSRYDKEVPVFNESFVSFEMYATNISFYIAQKTLDYEYTSYEKDISKKFCNNSTIEKLTYLIDYIESSILKSSSKSNEVVQDKKISATGYVAKISSPTTSSNTDIDTSSFTSEQWLELGKSKAEKGLYLEAISHFNQATKLDSNNAESWYFKANALGKIKKYQERNKCFEKALSLNLCDIYRKEALIHFSSWKYWLQEYDKALEYNSELLKLEKYLKNIPMYMYFEQQLIIYCRLGKYQEALECCDEMAELYSYASILCFKGDILFVLGRLEEAVEYYDKAILKSDDYSTDRANFTLHRGIALDALGKREAATKEYKKVIKQIDIVIAMLKQQPSAEKYFLKAMAYSKLGKLKEANECYGQISGRLYYHLLEYDYKLLKSYYALLGFSDYKNIYPIKADINAILRNYPEQMKCYEKMLELDPDNKSVLYDLWLLCDKIGKIEEAINYLKKIIKLVDDNPNKSRLYNSIGKTLCKLQKYQESLDYFNKALVIDISNTDMICTVDTLAHYANTLNLLGRHQESIEYFDKALSLDPYHTFSYLNKAKALSQLGKYCQSLVCCTEGLSLNPDDPDFLAVRNSALYGECKLSLTEDIGDIEYLIENIPLSQEAKNIAIKELNIIKSLNDNNVEKADHLKYLHNLLKLPWGQYDDVNIDLKKASSILDQEHYGLEEVKNRILESLVFITRSNFAKAPIICLVGPPGVGKTSIARSIANALGRKCIDLSFAGGSDTSFIRGCMKFYRDSHPGKILSLMTEVGSSNPVMVLDEIDKIDKSNYSRGNGLESALLQLLDTAQNSRFTDEYFDFPFDLSKVFFITTANSLEQVSYPLINRMEVIELSGYTDEEKLQITNNYLLPKILKEANLTDKKLEIDNTIIKYLIKHYTKESGVRDIERTLRIIIQKYLVDEIKGNKPTVNLALIEQYLGIAKYQAALLDQTAKVGTAIGLSYTANGGSTMTIEAEKFPGEGKIQATGKLGEILKESVEAALAYLKANSEELGITPQSFKKYDLHLHLLEGAVSKEGPSAGITIYVALASLLSGKKVRQDIAMTGELTLKGKILPIGGLKEKLSAAVRENINTVIIPEGNKRDVAKIPAEIRDVLTIIPISHASELLDIIFIDKKL